jgi:phosphoglycolate phosphatase
VNYQLVSFDLDGTLVDTASEIAEAANLALESHGIARRPVLEITHLVGAGIHSLMTRLLARCLAEQPELAGSVTLEQMLVTLDGHYARTTGTMAELYPGAVQALERLRAADVRVACVTNKEFRHAERVLQVTGLTPYFDLIIGGDSLAEKKPHASVLHHVMAEFGSTPARTAHVGDSAIDVQAARNAGVSAWAVPYGYNSGVPISTASPDRLFQSLPEVADHVLGRA